MGSFSLTSTPPLFEERKPRTHYIHSDGLFFFPLIVSALIAGLAMLGSVQAERRQREFVERQQAFVARITHELKTPLAGIRLMAESLQLGIVQSPEQEKQFTERNG